MLKRTLLLLLSLAFLPGWMPGGLPAGSSSPTSIVTNFDGNGTASANQITTYDQNGNVIDAFAGGIQEFNGTFYWYGMGMGCGFVFTFVSNTAPFCGFNVYASVDLVNWQNVGPMFNPAQWQVACNVGQGTQGCFEPHGAYNALTGLYVFWFMTFSGTPTNDGYLVVTCTTPYNGCTEAPIPTVAKPDRGDVDLFVDPTTNIAYIVHGFSGNSVVEQLNSSYTNTTGAFVNTGDGCTAGNTMYYNSGTYYVGCSASTWQSAPTYFSYSSTPLGTYTVTRTQVAPGPPQSCGGQQLAEYLWPSTGSTLYFQSELWNGAAGNQGMANHFFGPITFTGTTPSVTCSASVSVPGVYSNGYITAYANGADQTDETKTFRSICDITATQYRLQTFVPSRNGAIKQVQLPLAQNILPSVCNYDATAAACSGPDGSVTISVVTLDGSNNPTGTLWSQSITGSTLSWTPKETVLPVSGASVTGGTSYGLEISASNTKACYSVAYSNNLQYPAGVERVSANSGSTWTTDAGASLKFSVFLN